MYELYDLENDPAERYNLSNTLPEVTKELSSDLIEWRKKVGAQSMTINSK